jgi:hypothetical protein
VVILPPTLNVTDDPEKIPRSNKTDVEAEVRFNSTLSGAPRLKELDKPDTLCNCEVKVCGKFPPWDGRDVRLNPKWSAMGDA